jgi:hypothetical protein
LQISSTQKVRRGHNNDSFCFYFGTNRAQPIDQSEFSFFATFAAFTHFVDSTAAFLAFSMVEGSSRSKKSYYLENSQVVSFAHQVASFAHQARCFASETPIAC